jgi:hypothetical protein
MMDRRRLVRVNGQHVLSVNGEWNDLEVESAKLAQIVSGEYVLMMSGEYALAENQKHSLVMNGGYIQMTNEGDA